MSTPTVMNFEYRGPAKNVIKNGHDMANLMAVLETHKGIFSDIIPEGYDTFLIMRVNNELDVICAFDSDVTKAVVVGNTEAKLADDLIGTNFEVIEPILDCAMYYQGEGFDPENPVVPDSVSHIRADYAADIGGVREHLPVVEIKEAFVVDFAGGDILIVESFRGLKYTMVIRNAVIHLDKTNEHVVANAENAAINIVSTNTYNKKELAVLPINLTEFF